jgi:hypothetical protein
LGDVKLGDEHQLRNTIIINIKAYHFSVLRFNLPVFSNHCNMLAKITVKITAKPIPIIHLKGNAHLQING